jgi:transmembrane sensor
MKIVDFTSARQRKDALQREQQLSVEARHWVVRIDSEDMGPDERHAFEEWLQRSPAHRKVFADTAKNWINLDCPAVLLGTPQAAVTNHPAPDPATHKRSAPVMAACVLLVIAMTGWQLLSWQSARNTDYFQTYTTAIGEVAKVSLPDTSSVDINSRSLLHVAFDKSSRAVILPQGEAYFAVAHDIDKPFIVHAGRFSVRAVGTAFMVSLSDENISVLVTEGEVEVSMYDENIEDAEALQSRIMHSPLLLTAVSAGQSGEFDKAGQTPQVNMLADQHLNRSLAWRDGLLMFDNDSLEAVVVTLNRYSPSTITITDDSIRNLRVGGFFRVEDIDAILATLENNYDITVERVDQERIHLYSAPAAL